MLIKKLVFCATAACALILTSCGSFKSTTTTATKFDVATAIGSVNVADLEVGNRVTFRYTTTDNDRAGGANNCKDAAVSALLKQNGNADVLVSPEYSYDSDMKVIEVSGRPASYKNFRGAN
ncbi:MAG: hypothetical protein NC402_00110 [Prevotella sp.]|nr:hypothetical protein [Prevotella sp.]MCM1074413.1 hypothetical protein [Ruminococcus sp.]